LSSKRESTPERLQGETETKSELKFAALSTLSDSEEAEMEMSDDSNTERPRKKRALGLDGLQDVVPAPPVPKWSNPDPYTALPPPAETTNKRVDVVKLIRKARLDTAPKTDEMDAVKQNSDFISLGMDFEPEVPQSNAPDNAPKGPKAQEVLDPAITSRKRTRDDEIKGYSRKTGKPASRFNHDGSVIDQWKPLSPETGTPWFEGTPAALHIGTQSVLSFMNFLISH
jgi:non-canonical poly(A) RNA polymerase PAPD5/7